MVNRRGWFRAVFGALFGGLLARFRKPDPETLYPYHAYWSVEGQGAGIEYDFRPRLLPPDQELALLWAEHDALVTPHTEMVFANLRYQRTLPPGRG